ncbi:MAG TPA: helix-turn-helix transcriptional regulator [Acidimicrobiales bacterium]|nr:helix-turn-helix transcriptional regulator [Acidimicrobiales bacterium]
MYGTFIRAVRESKGLTQDQLARTVGISQPNLSAYERNRRIPNANTLNKLLVACGYQLAAADGTRVLYCPLPAAGWFPDDDLPAAEPGDPSDEAPTITAHTPMAHRVRAINAVLELADTTRQR